MPIIKPAHQLTRFRGRGFFDGIKNIFGSIGRLASGLFGSAKQKGLTLAREALPQLGNILKQQALAGLSQVASGRNPEDVLRQRAGLALSKGIDTVRPVAQKSIRQLLQEARRGVEQENISQDLKQLVRSQVREKTRNTPLAPVSGILSRLMDRQKLSGRGIVEL